MYSVENRRGRRVSSRKLRILEKLIAKLSLFVKIVDTHNT